MTLLAGVRAVVFDAVGTVLEPDPPAADVYAEAAARFGLAADPAEVFRRIRAAFRAEEARDGDAGWVTSEARELERWRAVVAASLPGGGEPLFRELFAHFAQPTSWRVPADAPATVASLAARGLRLGIGSNFDGRLETVLAGRQELAALTGRVVVSSRVGVRKPHPGFFRTVADVMRCEPREILFVGDDVGNDFVGASAAGMRAVLLDPADRHPDIVPRVRALSELA